PVAELLAAAPAPAPAPAPPSPAAAPINALPDVSQTASTAPDATETAQASPAPTEESVAPASPPAEVARAAPPPATAPAPPPPTPVASGRTLGVRLFPTARHRLGSIHESYTAPADRARRAPRPGRRPGARPDPAHRRRCAGNVRLPDRVQRLGQAHGDDPH